MTNKTKPLALNHMDEDANYFIAETIYDVVERDLSHLLLIDKAWNSTQEDDDTNKYEISDFEDWKSIVKNNQLSSHVLIPIKGDIIKATIDGDEL